MSTDHDRRSEMQAFQFEHARAFVVPMLLWGVGPTTGQVLVDENQLRVRFGPWTLQTPLANIVATEVAGPYRWWRAIGIRLSLADRGITFGTTASGGVCLQLNEPVSLQIGRLSLPMRHPNVTVTVVDRAGLARALEG
jgi:hypothetical protein